MTQFYKLHNGIMTAKVVRETASQVIIQTNWKGYVDYHTVNKSAYTTLDEFVNDNYSLPS